MTIVSIGDFDMFYEEHGSGEPVLLVAGLGGAGAYWQPNLDAFARRYRTIMPDHRGTGGSSPSRINYSVKQMTDDLVGLMDALDIERAHLVGHSLGGAIGQTMALDYPERLKSMVLYASWTKADAFMHRVMGVRRALLGNEGAQAYMWATSALLYPDWWVNENDALLRQREQGGVKRLPPPEISASRIDAVLAFDRTDELHRINTPTQVICAQDDFLTPLYYSEQLARTIPGAQLEVFATGGHACSEVDPEGFNSAVFRFLDSHVR